MSSTQIQNSESLSPYNYEDEFEDDKSASIQQTNTPVVGDDPILDDSKDQIESKNQLGPQEQEKQNEVKELDMPSQPTDAAANDVDNLESLITSALTNNHTNDNNTNQTNTVPETFDSSDSKEVEDFFEGKQVPVENTRTDQLENNIAQNNQDTDQSHSLENHDDIKESTEEASLKADIVTVGDTLEQTRIETENTVNSIDESGIPSENIMENTEIVTENTVNSINESGIPSENTMENTEIATENTANSTNEAEIPSENTVFLTQDTTVSAAVDNTDNPTEKSEIPPVSTETVVDSSWNAGLVAQTEDVIAEKNGTENVDGSDEKAAEKEVEQLQDDLQTTKQLPESSADAVTEKDTAPANYEVDTINKKRQEEKEVFQKLIDDVTRLENEKQKLNETIEGLKVKVEIQTIELETGKEAVQEKQNQIVELEHQLEKSTHAMESTSDSEKIQELERVIMKYERLVAKAEHELGAEKMQELQQDDAIERGPNNQQEVGSSQAADESEVRDLHMRITTLVQNDEAKSKQIEELEEKTQKYSDLLVKVKHEIGAQRLQQLEDGHQLNGNTQLQGGNNGPQSNTVNPDAAKSSVCVIL